MVMQKHAGLMLFFTDYTVGQMRPVWQPQMSKKNGHEKTCNFFLGGGTDYTVGQMQPVWQPHTCNVEAEWSCKNMQVYFNLFLQITLLGKCSQYGNHRRVI